jgi:anaerobic selenocysteine-containing dehydrogenase
MDKEVFRLCFMCSVRCPIKVKDGHVDWIEGKQQVPIYYSPTMISRVSGQVNIVPEDVLNPL